MPVAVPVETGTGHLALVAAGPAHRITAADADELIRAQVTVVRLACEQMTGPAFRLLHASVDRACCLPAGPGWERKTAAHAEIFRQLAGLAGGPAATAAHTGQARLIRDLMRAVGPVANGMITSSRRRLLADLLAGNADAAALETEAHLRTLYFMWRVAGRPAPRAGRTAGRRG